MGESGGGSWGMRRHRQGAHGKDAYPPSRWNKQRRAMDLNAADAERSRLARGKRRLQDFVDAAAWLHRGGHR